MGGGQDVRSKALERRFALSGVADSPSEVYDPYPAIAENFESALQCLGPANEIGFADQRDDRWAAHCALLELLLFVHFGAEEGSHVLHCLVVGLGRVGDPAIEHLLGARLPPRLGGGFVIE